MKNIRLYTLTLAFTFLLSNCTTYRQDLSTIKCEAQGIVNHDFPNQAEIKASLHRLTEINIPGVAIAVYTVESGWWQYATGLAKIEDETPMQTCHLHYLQSIAKTYMSVAILKLYEEKQLDIEKDFLNYLPSAYQEYLPFAKGISIRMLLDHTSGLPEYNLDAAYVSDLIQYPDRSFSAKEYLQYIQKKSLQFQPGSKFRYTNTNYLLLALIADQITNDHAKYISDLILKPLSLKNTFYRYEENYLQYPEIYNAYWDRFSNGILENVSQWQRQNVSDMIGDDGIVATPKDAVQFLRGLMEGKLLKEKSLELMKEGFKRKDGSINYGLGLDWATFAGHQALGHSGGGLGAGCQLYYFPEKGLYCFIGINLGTVTESPIHEKALPILEEIYRLLLNP